MTLRFRGTAFDSYDGKAWDRTIKASSGNARHADGDNEGYTVARTIDPRRDRKIPIELEPIDPPVVFLPPRTTGLRLRAVEPALLNDNLTLHPGRRGNSATRGATAAASTTRPGSRPKARRSAKP